MNFPQIIRQLAEIHYSDVWGSGLPALIKKWRGQKKDPSLFVQFTNYGDNTLSRQIHQSPDHADMAAVYAYPLQYVVDHPADIWYGFNSKFARVLKSKARRTCVLSSLNWSDVNSILYRMGIPIEHVDAARKQYKDRAKGVTAPGKILMSCVQMALDKDMEGEDGPFKRRDYIVRSSAEQTALFLKAGFDAVEDRASRISQASINDREPHQIAFLRPQAFEVVEVVRLSDPRKNRGNVSPDYGHVAQKVAAQIAAVMGDTLSSSEFEKIFWTKGGREISVEDSDTSVHSRMKRLKLGQRDFKAFRKHTPQQITATIRSERGDFTATAFSWDKVSTIVDTFKSQWTDKEGEDSGEKYSRQRRDDERKERDRAGWAKQREKEVADCVKWWPSRREGLIQVAQGLGLPEPPDLSDPDEIYDYNRVLTSAVRYTEEDKDDFLRTAEIMGWQVHPSHLGFIKAMTDLNPDFKSASAMVYKFKELHEAVATDDEYWGLLSDERPDLVDVTRGAEAPMSWMGVRIQNRKTASGRLVVRWGEQGDVIFILGIVARGSRLSRQDASELRQWIDELVQHLLDGKTVATSTNEKSGPLLDAVKREIADLGKEVEVTEMGRTRVGGQDYVNVMLSV